MNTSFGKHAGTVESPEQGKTRLLERRIEGRPEFGKHGELREGATVHPLFAGIVRPFMPDGDAA